MRKYLQSVFGGGDLSREQAQGLMDLLLLEETPDEQIAALLGALAVKGCSAVELAGFASSLLSHAHIIDAKDSQAVDTCGTGGDGKGLFNISTAAVFVLAGAGARVAKHGNRSISSLSGSADVLEQLGMAVNFSPARCEALLEEAGLAFMFAPLFHPAMKRVGPVRRAIGERSVFNMLGPLCNPARVKCQVLGVYDPALCRLFAETLRELGSESVMVVSGMDSTDEMILWGETHIAQLKQGKILEYRINAAELGIEPAALEAVKGGDSAHNAQMIRGVLSGEPGPCRDIVALNAAAGLMVAAHVVDLKEGLALAYKSIDSGAAAGALEKLQGATV